VLWNSEVREITGTRSCDRSRSEDKTTKTTKEMAVDGVFIGIGYIRTTNVAKQLKLELDDHGLPSRRPHHDEDIGAPCLCRRDITGRAEADIVVPLPTASMRHDGVGTCRRKRKKG